VNLNEMNPLRRAIGVVMFVVGFVCSGWASSAAA
jgi:hypothetical protein